VTCCCLHIHQRTHQSRGACTNATPVLFEFDRPWLPLRDLVSLLSALLTPGDRFAAATPAAVGDDAAVCVCPLLARLRTRATGDALGAITSGRETIGDRDVLDDIMLASTGDAGGVLSSCNRARARRDRGDNTNVDAADDDEDEDGSPLAIVPTTAGTGADGAVTRCGAGFGDAGAGCNIDTLFVDDADSDNAGSRALLRRSPSHEYTAYTHDAR
jgi:hypothetical protein